MGQNELTEKMLDIGFPEKVIEGKIPDFGLDKQDDEVAIVQKLTEKEEQEIDRLIDEALAKGIDIEEVAKKKGKKLRKVVKDKLDKKKKEKEAKEKEKKSKEKEKEAADKKKKKVKEDIESEMGDSGMESEQGEEGEGKVTIEELIERISEVLGSHWEPDLLQHVNSILGTNYSPDDIVEGSEESGIGEKKEDKQGADGK